MIREDYAKDQRIEQAGLDIEYRVLVEKYDLRKSIYKSNKHKAYTIIYGYCNQTMKNRIEEDKFFDKDIQNNTFRILEEIKLKMYGQVWAKYEYTQVTDTLVQFINTKQQHRELLTDYGKRFKQSRENVK